MESVRNISEICYEQIKDDYWYADYLGFKVVMMKSNCYINATKLCNDGAKRFEHWIDNKHSKGMLNFYQKKLNQSQSSVEVFPLNLTLGAANTGIKVIASGNATNTNNTIFPINMHIP